MVNTVILNKCEKQHLMCFYVTFIAIICFLSILSHFLLFCFMFAEWIWNVKFACLCFAILFNYERFT